VTGPRFGIWAPVYGAFGATRHPEDVRDAGYRRTRDLVLAAERWGYSATLVAQHVTNPGEPEADVLETWSTVAALAEATTTIELIGAIKPLLANPGVFAKQAANIADISAGRLAINLVAGWYLPELEQLGVAAYGHDERYAHAREWLHALTSLWADQPVPAGRYVSLPGFAIRPLPGPRRPPVYLGGESPPARELAADAADVFFVNGRPVAQTRALIEDLRARPRPADRPPLRFALSAFVIVRDTDAEAAAELARLQRLVDADDHEIVACGTDTATAMTKVHAGQRRVGSNGGTLAGLVGSARTVRRRIGEFHEAGIELFMLQFQPLEREAERFARDVLAYYVLR
jgi:alkanesulfonate monooxygenase